MPPDNFVGPTKPSPARVVTMCCKKRVREDRPLEHLSVFNPRRHTFHQLVFPLQGGTIDQKPVTTKLHTQVERVVVLGPYKSITIDGHMGMEMSGRRREHLVSA